jgi:hypothetical protein
VTEPTPTVSSGLPVDNGELNLARALGDPSTAPGIAAHRRGGRRGRGFLVQREDLDGTASEHPRTRPRQ